MTAAPEQLYRWHWRARLPDRHGQLFRLLLRGETMNSCLIEFLADGHRVVTSRNALRKVREQPAQATPTCLPRMDHA